MSWHCSLALVEDFSRLGCLDGEQCAQLSGSRTASKCSVDARKKGILKRSRYGMTCEPSTVSRGVAAWMSLLPDSLASRSALSASEQAPTMNGTGGRQPFASLEKCSRDGACWKTSQVSLLTTITEPYSGTWPRAGMMLDGACYRQPKWELRIAEIGSGLWPTACANDDNKTPEAHMAMKQRMKGGPRQTCTSLQVMVKGVSSGMWATPMSSDVNGGRTTKGSARQGETGLRSQVIGGSPTRRTWPTPKHRDGDSRGPQAKRYYNPERSNDQPDAIAAKDKPGQLNPAWVEWLMGWPIGWTALEPLATDRFRSWLRSHGRC